MRMGKRLTRWIFFKIHKRHQCGGSGWGDVEAVFFGVVGVHTIEVEPELEEGDAAEGVGNGPRERDVEIAAGAVVRKVDEVGGGGEHADVAGGEGDASEDFACGAFRGVPAA
jgi:hypothetical protein